MTLSLLTIQRLLEQSEASHQSAVIQKGLIKLID